MELMRFRRQFDLQTTFGCKLLKKRGDYLPSAPCFLANRQIPGGREVTRIALPMPSGTISADPGELPASKWPP